MLAIERSSCLPKRPMRLDHCAAGLVALALSLAGTGRAFQGQPPPAATSAFSRNKARAPFSFHRLASTSRAQEQTVSSGSDSGIPRTTPDVEAYAAGYKTVFDELPCAVKEASEGRIPDDLVGTYFRSGPAMFSAGSIPPPKLSLIMPKDDPVPDGANMERMVDHPFEGDGAVLGVTFPGDGTAVARFRYVRTNAFTNERKKGRKVYVGMDSTRSMGGPAGGRLGNDHPLPMFRHHLLPGLNKKRKNTSNTRSVYWAKKLITLWEGGLPYKLDSLALSTEGRSQLGGVLKEQDPFGGSNFYDAKADRMLFYSNFQDVTSSKLKLYEFNSKFRLVPEQGGVIETELPGFAQFSDFAATETHAVFVQPPMTVNNIQYLTSKDPGKTLTVEERATTLLHLVPRVGSGKGGPRSISIPYDGMPDFDLQFINAYDAGEGEAIVFDVIRADGRAVGANPLSWPWATSVGQYSQSAAKKSLWRYTVQMGTGAITKECLSDTHASFGVINPAVSGQKHRYVYAAVGGMGSEVAPPQGIAKFDVDSGSVDAWMPKGNEFCGEPMFAPRANADGEDGGYIVSVLYNGQKDESEMVVLDAKDIRAGPVARVPLGMVAPHGYHGCFSSSNESGWTAEEIDRRAKLADKMEGKGAMWNEVKSDFSGLGLRLDDIEEYFGDFFG